jgi:iron complex transport system substrate-binding protein
MQRIVSLIASSTEIVCALGCSNQLVGISHECDFPPEILTLPRCTSTKFPTDVSSAAIDMQVKAIVQKGLSVYLVNADRVRDLKPDILITQTQCEVCAVSLKDVEAAVCDIIGDTAVVSLHPNALQDIWADIRRVAQALGIVDRGEALISALQQRMDTIHDKAQALTHHPTLAYIEWIDPLMAGGNWMPELVELAGGVNCFGEAGKHSPWMTWEALRTKDPEIIVVAPCGFDIQRSIQEMPPLTQRSDWCELQAVKHHRVFIADGNQYFNRPGPRVVESLEILAELCHPETFDYGHEANGWQRFE